jgi:putative transposase
VIETIRQGLKEDGLAVPVSKLCRWIGVPRRTVYYRPDEESADRSAAVLATDQTADRRTSCLWLSHRGSSAGPQQAHGTACSPVDAMAGAKTSCGLQASSTGDAFSAAAPNERWATDLCRVWTGRDGWAVLALVMDCHSRELLGWHLSRSGKSKTVEAALEQALIARYGTLGRVPRPFLLRSD